MKKYLEIALWVAFLGAAGYAIYTFIPKGEEVVDGSYIKPITPSPSPDPYTKFTGDILMPSDAKFTKDIEPGFQKRIVEV